MWLDQKIENNMVDFIIVEWGEAWYKRQLHNILYWEDNERNGQKTWLKEIVIWYLYIASYIMLYFNQQQFNIQSRINFFKIN
jgi:hypothetical protein